MRCGLCLAVVNRGYSLDAVHRLFIAVASVFAEHRLWDTGASAVVAPKL